MLVKPQSVSVKPCSEMQFMGFFFGLFVVVLNVFLPSTL